MRDRLEIDTGAVRNLSENMRVVHSALDDAQASSDAVANMVAHAQLAGAITEFSSMWDDRRRELLEQVSMLKDAATAVADAFDSADNELAAAILGDER